ncbi:collagen alpha-2(I) chain-like [Falco cherrug]|uniref:collagen alpha-2(I) chain-like n=1 Tax=Falco cherrug TaxID=345164 RepID=UPI00247980D4|nr:collagen alpha-2(I) chain-like [Falco cherrug]
MRTRLSGGRAGAVGRPRGLRMRGGGVCRKGGASSVRGAWSRFWSLARPSEARAGSAGPRLLRRGPATPLGLSHYAGPAPPGLARACYGRVTHSLSQQPRGADGTGDVTVTGRGGRRRLRPACAVPGPGVARGRGLLTVAPGGSPVPAWGEEPSRLQRSPPTPPGAAGSGCAGAESAAPAGGAASPDLPWRAACRTPPARGRAGPSVMPLQWCRTPSPGPGVTP